MPIEKEIMRNFKQGEFGPGDTAKKGTGGSIDHQLIKKNKGNANLTDKQTPSRGPGVNSAFWAKHGNRALYKDFG